MEKATEKLKDTNLLSEESLDKIEIIAALEKPSAASKSAAAQNGVPQGAPPN